MNGLQHMLNLGFNVFFRFAPAKLGLVEWSGVVIYRFQKLYVKGSFIPKL